MTYGILKLFSIFTIISITLYQLCPAKYRHVVLTAVSLSCVGYYSRAGVFYLLITIITTYGVGIVMDKISSGKNTAGLEKAERKKVRAEIRKRKKAVVAVYISVNLGILFMLKYSGMFLPEGSIGAFAKIGLPLGISYYTLQCMGYVIDVFRGKFPAEKSFVRLALFAGFLPQLHEGPFGRYDLMADSMFRNENLKAENVFGGAATIILGLFKIFMISNRAAIIADSIFSDYRGYSEWVILFGGIAFTLQLYAEFSGYIDIASGISEIFGIKLAENFNMPFLAEDVSEFWRRWHISLGAWFRDYVFYPVSTSRVFRKVPDFLTLSSALLVVWFLTGLWHGADVKYIVYGLYYFALMVITNAVTAFIKNHAEKKQVRINGKIIRVTKILLTQLLVVTGMIMFRAENLTVFADMMTSFSGTGREFALLSVIDIKELAVLIVSTAALIAGALMKSADVHVKERYMEMSGTGKYAVCFGVLCIVIIFGAYGLDYIPPDPIYGGF